MRMILALMMAGLAGQVWAQSGEPDIPLELRDMQENDPRARNYEPVDAPGIDPAAIAAALAKPPEPCVDLTAVPRLLPNGNDQYPVIACRAIDYTQPFAEAQATAARPVAVRPVAQPMQVQQALPVADGRPMDLNTLQMQRLGQLDAMQGMPINMRYASTLGYMQGYTAGQKMRLQPQGGGFGGFAR